MVRLPGERVPTGFGLHGLLPLIALTTHILAVVRTAKVATLTNQDRQQRALFFVPWGALVEAVHRWARGKRPAQNVHNVPWGVLVEAIHHCCSCLPPGALPQGSAGYGLGRQGTTEFLALA